MVDIVRQLSGSSSKLVLGYKVCDSTTVANCYLSESDMNLAGRSPLTKLGYSRDLVTYGSLTHDPSNFDNPGEYYVYQFAVYNPNSDIAVVDFYVDNLATFNQVLDKDIWYRNN